jgi:hypothetical protein
VESKDAITAVATLAAVLGIGGQEWRVSQHQQAAEEVSVSVTALSQACAQTIEAKTEHIRSLEADRAGCRAMLGECLGVAIADEYTN